MFSFIRWVSAGSFVLVMLGVLAFGHEFRQVASEDLVTIINNSNASMARGFQTTTWKTYREQMHAGLEWYRKFKSSGVPSNQWKNYNGYQDMMAAFNVMDKLTKSTFKDFEDTSIVEVNLYTPDGMRLISVNQSRTLWSQDMNALNTTVTVNVTSDKEFAQAVSGKISNSTMFDQPYIKPDGSNDRATLVRGLYPVFADNGLPNAPEVLVDSNTTRPLDAVLELRYDVSLQWNQLDFFHHISVYGVMGMFSAIILLMLFTSGKAEAIIAKQHDANLELAGQAATAQAENRDKSQFLANVSHELRTPLNAIIGFSEFIKSERSGKIGNEKYAEYIRDIHGSGVHLLSLINDILDYSKAEADKLDLDVAEVDATKLVKNSMRLVYPRAENAQVQLLEEIPREHFILETDAKKLKQVLLNLLSNAVKFTPSGGSVTVTMWQNVVDGGLAIEVRDTGIGIAPKDISRAMAPFGQVDNTLSRKYEGTGLGLPLTRKFVEIMGGTFNIVSEVGKGTIITITLPKKPKGKNDIAAPVAAIVAPPEKEIAKAETPHEPAPVVTESPKTLSF